MEYCEKGDLQQFIDKYYNPQQVNKKYMQGLRQSQQILNKIQTPQRQGKVVAIFNPYQVSEDKKQEMFSIPVIVMQRVKGQTLLQFAKSRPSREQIDNMVIDSIEILKAIKKLQSNSGKYIHGDLNIHSILYDSKDRIMRMIGLDSLQPIDEFLSKNNTIQHCSFYPIIHILFYYCECPKFGYEKYYEKHWSQFVNVLKKFSPETKRKGVHLVDFLLQN